jgi:hypothetical protein
MAAGDWWDQNAPPAAQGTPPAATPGFTPDPGHGTPVAPGSPPFVQGQPPPAQYTNTGASGGLTPTGDPSQWLQDQISHGVPPQTAIDALNAAGGAYAALKADYYPGNNTIGLANGTYLTPNPQGVWGPVTRGPEGGAGGSAANPGALPVTPFGGIGSTPDPYVSPQWTGGPAPTAPQLQAFTAPTEAQLEASPGYQSRLAAGLLAENRSAAAHGTVLNGGTQQALARYGQDYASNEYQNLFGQSLATNQNNNAVTQGNFGNAFQTYQANYGAFQDAANRGFNTYQANVGNARNAGNDYWSQLNSLYQTGAATANSSYKPSAVP